MNIKNDNDFSEFIKCNNCSQLPSAHSKMLWSLICIHRMYFIVLIKDARPVSIRFLKKFRKKNVKAA
jgi:hypothetical protein